MDVGELCIDEWVEPLEPGLLVSIPPSCRLRAASRSSRVSVLPCILSGFGEGVGLTFDPAGAPFTACPFGCGGGGMELLVAALTPDVRCTPLLKLLFWIISLILANCSAWL